ncbi:MAG TPA: hypothetical protein VJ739_16515 [Gemmataceae bacterium]|nr:hypothetical protein [Gemmataceae bacterium]
MHIAILEHDPAQKSATGVRGRAIKDYLAGQGHRVEFVSPAKGAAARYNRRRFSFGARLRRRLSGRKTLPHLWDYLADELEPQIRRGGFDAVIARGQDLAHVLTRPLDCLKILDMANILYLEAYYAWGANKLEVEETYEKEVRVWQGVDFILSPHQVLTDYFLEHLAKVGDLSAKTRTVRLGCEPPARVARYAEPPRLVYAGSYYYIQDPYLLAQLARVSPYPIDCYGPEDPNRSFLPAALSYRGYEAGTGFLADYQFGLITVSRDALRQHSPSTKFPYYFAHGLPVLFPEWMKEGYEYEGCAVPYNEADFVSVLQSLAGEGVWRRMSKAAQAVASRLSWQQTLQPLGDLLKQSPRPCGVPPCAAPTEAAPIPQA